MNALRLASLPLVIGALTGCGLALEPRYYKESGALDDATLASDGSTVTSDGGVVASDGGVIEPHEGGAVMSDAIVAPVDGGGVSADGNFVPRDGGVIGSDAMTARDAGPRTDSALTTNDGGSPCAAGQLPCSGACVRSDELNCGACGVRCLMTEICRAGSCVPCDPGQTLCRDGAGQRCCLASCPMSGMFACLGMD